MKRIFISTVLLALAVASFAQVSVPVEIQGEAPVLLPEKTYYQNPPNPAGLQGFYVDYAASDQQVFGNMGTQSWELGTTNTLFRHVIVSLDTLIDPNLNGYAWNEIAFYRIDSIFALIGHSNISGDTNQIILEVRDQGPNNYPNTVDLLLWNDTIFTDTSLTGLWNTFQQFSWAPGLILDPSVRIAAFLRTNLGAGDRAGFSADYPIDGPCLPNFPNTIVGKHSAFWPNSFTYYNQFTNQFPTWTGADVYYDCDGSNDYVDSLDGENYIQDAAIWFYVSVHLCDVGLTVNVDNHDWGTGNGCATVIPGPGPAPYAYAWSTGGTDVQECNLNFGTYSVVVTDSTGCQDSTTYIILLVEGTDDQLNIHQEIAVYPNPVKENATITLSDIRPGEYEFTIFNLLGAPVIRKEAVVNSSGQIELQLTSISKGIYMLNLRGSDTNQVGKIVIQ